MPGERVQLPEPALVAQLGSQLRCALLEQPPVAGGDVAPDLVPKPGGRGAGEDARGAAVGRNRADADPLPVVPVRVLEPGARPVAVDDAGRVPARVLDLGARQAGDGGAQAIGADHDSGGDPRRRPVGALDDGAAHPAAVVADQIDDADPVHDLGAGVAGRIDQRRVEHRPPRRVERIDPVARFDRDDQLVVTVVEGGPPDRRRAGRLERAEHPPAMELEHTGAHQGVGGEGVAPVGLAVDGQHPQAAAGQQHGGRGPGAARPDDDGVVALDTR